jgi:predicted CxxxxCH...CXXCH cytochrome family protein
MRRPSLLLLPAVVGALGLHCAKARPVANDPRGVLTWQQDIQPLFSTQCAGCHTGADAGGVYDVTTYNGVLGNGTHASPDAVAGDVTCVLLQTLNPVTADAVHQPVATTSLFATVQQWVVVDDLAFFTSSIHGGGILNPADSQFHGEVLKDNAWNFQLCASCHGTDFSGGGSQVSCLTCHAQGVTTCSTCHGRYGQSEAHATHVDGGALGKQFDCSECHLKPASYLDVGHLFDADGGLVQGVSVVFAATSLAATNTPTRTNAPTWDAGTQSCSNVYCHGGAFADTSASNTTPLFDLVGTGQAACGTCHGLPPSDHAAGQTQCSFCHGLVVDANRHFINPALHLNGVVDVGNDDGTCSACHGDATSSAPPKDLSGNTNTTALGVGAHRSHVQGLHKLAAPIPCGGCHYGTPANVTDPGHIDSPPPAKVFPGGQAFTGLAAADGTDPVWDAGAATCTAYCHGSGMHLADDASQGLNRAPLWTSVGTGEAGCGTCHGIPPRDGVPGHDAGTPLTACAACHPSTMDSSGAILVTLDGGVLTSTHINGVIDVVP